MEASCATGMGSTRCRACPQRVLGTVEKTSLTLEAEVKVTRQMSLGSHPTCNYHLKPLSRAQHCAESLIIPQPNTAVPWGWGAGNLGSFRVEAWPDNGRVEGGAPGCSTEYLEGAAALVPPT